MKIYTKEGKLTLAEMTGRLPVPKPGSVMKPNKGKGAYTRKAKHKKGWSDNKLIIPFLF